MSYNEELYQRVILDHNKNPRNFRKMTQATHECEGRNPLCGDYIKLFLILNKENKVEDISFDGSGCAISQASSSMMTEYAKGKTVEQLKVCFEEFGAMTKGNLNLEEQETSLGKLKLFEGVKEFSSRVKCANLSWHALVGALEKDSVTSTEDASNPSLDNSKTYGIVIDEFLDLTGVKCPINFVKAKVKLSTMESNSVLALILDDGDPVRNVSESLKMEHHTILSQTKINDQHKVIVQKF